ncbi:uncharacterized protein B0I36DRAFT_15122 [Microdochium trichocladiopsis]|uniref:Carboxylesterase family protein n=1 Tax=Microdochium trichocladiopsis TaxID=1682393 RepID=A0A9P9BU92_9PEZI|nr:uncharacterized protein B0I36DRAFT_15122 [Microdochium trichocladiopsis]KAH7040766.1 hypothetical protein B0I36DRAFT_15122 [Microdochium trichocladiopsis]
MALSVHGRPHFEIHVDHHASDTDSALQAAFASSQVAPLQSLSPAQLQNRHRDVPSATHDPACSDTAHVIASDETGTLGSGHHCSIKPSRPGKQQQHRRPNPRSSSALETVPENKSTSFGAPALELEHAYRCLELPAHLFPGHPVLTATGNIPSAESQRRKHQNGDFEWVLAINQPPNQSATEPTRDHDRPRRLLLGCNLYPQAQKPKSGISEPQRVLLLATPLEDQENSLEHVSLGAAQVAEIMAATDAENKSLVSSPLQQSQAPGPPRFIITVSDAEESQVKDTNVEASEPDSVARIEDSFEALDKLEDQLEAFDKAAIFKRVTISEPPASKPTEPLTTTPTRDVPALKHGSASVRVKSVAKAGQGGLRKSVSMVFDSPKVKKEEKPLIQIASKVSPARPPNTLVASKPLVKSTKPLTIPSFELPGEATARRLKEQREARTAAQLAEEEALKASAKSATLRRSKSARLTSLPTFELPGEAISRRKREERARQLKAQEEEERKRREFKARPVGLATVPTFVPRDTAASRARQQIKGATSENDSLRPITQVNGKRNSIGLAMSARGPLEASSNQGTPRGRALSSETRHNTRAVSHASSTGSVGHSSTVSAEDIQQQRRKGEGIYRRDSSYAKDREVEKREREELAKAARAEAAERSRLQSREWALKQARKRMTIGSIRDLQA